MARVPRRSTGGSGNPADLAGNTASYVGIASHATAAQKAVAVAFFQEVLASSSYAKARSARARCRSPRARRRCSPGSIAASYDTTIYNSVAKAPSFQYSWDQAMTPQVATPMLTNLAQVFELTKTPQKFESILNASGQPAHADPDALTCQVWPPLRTPAGRRPGPPRLAAPGWPTWPGSGRRSLLFGLFIVVPMIAAVALSFLRWNGLGSPHWVGGANWAQFLRDPVAHQSLIVTAKVVVLSWVRADADLDGAGPVHRGPAALPVGLRGASTCCRCCCPRRGSR